MTRLTEEERRAFRRFVAAPPPPLFPAERFVADTPEARLAYVRWVTAASLFFRGEKPVRFGGARWLL